MSTEHALVIAFLLFTISSKYCNAYTVFLYSFKLNGTINTVVSCIIKIKLYNISI